MLHVPVGANSFGLTTPSWGTTRPAAANGTSVTPGTSDYGSYASLHVLTADAYGILINVNSNSGSNASRNTLTNIGVDLAGGTSYTTLIPSLISGGPGTYATPGNGTWYYFPIFIPSGARVGAAGYGSVATAYRVGAMFMQRPSNPSMIRKGSFVEAIGISGTTGTAITAGTTNDGAWTLLGTTTNRCWWWQVGLQVSTADTAWTATVYHLDLAVGDGTTFDTIIQDLSLAMTTAEVLANPPLSAGVEWDVPAGSSIYVRAQCSGATDPIQMAAYGLGG